MHAHPKPPSDAEALHRYLHSGCQDSFRILVERHRPHLQWIAQRHLNGDAAAAADITQLVFLELLRKASALQSHPVLHGWLLTTTRRMARSQARKLQRRALRHQQAQHHLTPTQDHAPETVLPPAALDDALRRLPQEDQTLLHLRFFEKLPFARIGRKLGLRDNTARMRCRRALDRLQADLASHGFRADHLSIAALVATASTHTSTASVATPIAGALTTFASSLTSLSPTLMTPSKAGFIAAAALGFLAALPILSPRLTSASADAEATRLKARLARVEQELSSARQSLDARQRELESTRERLSELARLRAELARLKTPAATPAIAPPAIPTPHPDSAQSPPDPLEDLGTGSPEAASSTFFWSLRTGRRDRFMELIRFPSDVIPRDIPQLQEELFNRWTEQFARLEFGPTQTKRGEPDGTVVLSQDFTDRASGRSDSLLLFLRNHDDGWRIVIDDIPQRHRAPASPGP